ncbi:isoprenylcysteine carboxylmethyltransferase family protein [Microvirga sp. W0021]|uniref:Isoprenylcysteine carboxylmethyltransferase family protein n=1 Tax=Hohaiivirga grylli TaxID=3133970 RepID=A0ABV0BKE0_9HYPH
MLRILFATLGRFVFVFILLFSAAGNFYWLEGWLFLLIYTLPSGFSLTLLHHKNPELVYERLNPEKGQIKEDRIISWIILILLNIWIAILGFDGGRFQLGVLPEWTKYIGFSFLVLSQALIHISLKHNPFASTVVRFQTEREQRIIRTGPYKYIRHPIYLFNILLLLGGSFLIQSVIGLALISLFFIIFCLRIRFEEEFLIMNFDAYFKYRQEVKCKIIPFLY